MSARTPKRGSNKRSKPRPLAHSLGSSSGGRANLHSKQPQVGGGSDADENVAGCSRREQLPVKDHLMDKDHEVLTEGDIGVIVRRAREFLEEHGPSQEEELARAVGPRLVHGMRASFGSLVACLTRQPGFHLVSEGEYSYVYYLQSEEYEVTSSRGALVETRGVGVGDASPSSSSGSGSYASALDKQEEERVECRNACTQTAFSGTQSQSDQVMCGTQTASCYSREEMEEMLEKYKQERRLLVARIACLQADFGQVEEHVDVEGQQAASHTITPPESDEEEESANGSCSEEKEQEGSNSSSLSEGGVPGACLREKVVEEASRQAVWPPCKEDPLTICTEEDSLHETAVGLRHKPAAPLVKLQAEALNGAAESPEVPELAELHLHSKQSRASASSDQESVQPPSQCSSSGSTHKSKVWIRGRSREIIPHPKTLDPSLADAHHAASVGGSASQDSRVCEEETAPLL